MTRRFLLIVVRGAAKGGGSSTTMVFGGRVVNTPSDRTGEREVGSALFIMKRHR